MEKIIESVKDVWQLIWPIAGIVVLLIIAYFFTGSRNETKD